MPHRRTTRAATVLSAVALLITAIAAIDDSAAVGAEGDLAIAVNAGGTAYAATSGISFAADAPSPDIPGSFSGGRGSAVAGSISQTDDPMLYGTVRSGRDFSFAAAGLQAGDYAIELHLVEPEETAAGARLFDVTAEGTLVLDDYDIFTAAGGTLTAHAETLQATVLDGQLDITFGSVVGRPVVAAIAVTFVAAAPAGLSVSPASVDLGAVPVGASSDGVIAISNNGSTNAEILAAQAGAAAFTVIAPSLPAAVAPGSTVTLTVRFSPSIAGAASTELILDTDDTATPTLAVSLFGTGVVDGQPPDIDVSPVALDFGASPLGIPLSQDVTVLNVGSSDLTVTGASATGSPFAASAPLPATVTPNSDSVVTVTFTPLQAGVVTGELVLLSDDPDQPELVVPLTGASSAYAAGSVAVIGCSNTDQHIMGYLNASISDQLAPVPDLGGGALDVWAAGTLAYWAIYEQHRPVEGYTAAWLQICLRASDVANDNQAQLTAVVDEIIARDGSIPIFVSPLNSYVEGHVCSATGVDGPAIAAELADWAVEGLGVFRGPDTGPVGPAELRRDGCHLNAAGVALVGSQLAAFFDPS